METNVDIIFWLCGFFALWCAGVWYAERRADDLLPPPDRSVKRDIEIFDEMDKLKRDYERKT